MTKSVSALPLVLVSVFLFYGASTASAAYAPPVSVRILSASGTEERTFAIPSANNATGASLVAVDLGNDGVPEIITGNGLGNEPRVRVLRADGSEIGSFLAYSSDMGVGLNITACDITGDAIAEIITVPQKGGGPHVRVFDHMGKTIDNGGSFAYAESFREGVSFACGDLDGDEIAELVTLPAAGGGPHVRVWKWNAEASKLALWREFFVFDASDRRGLVGDVANGMLTVSSSRGMPANILTYSLASSITRESETSWQDEGTATGVVQITHDTNTRYLVIEGAQHIVALDDANHLTTTVDNFSPRMAIANVDQDDADEWITITGRPLYADISSDGTSAKSILVDLSDQRLYAYESGVLANTFFISSGKFPYRTPVGKHAVLAKLPYVYYAGVDLDGTAWDLGSVPWNLRFYPRHYIHYAYWHNNFGNPMSHGCVNVNLENMKWIYEWSDVGVPVEVRE